MVINTEGEQVIDQHSLQALRIDLAEKSKWNIGFYWSGLVFWIYATGIGIAFPLESAKVLWFVGSWFIVPMAIPFSKLCHADAFPKENSLADLVGLTHLFVNLLGFPMILVALIYFPEAQILVMAILYCIDFYVSSWTFQNRLFVIASLIRVGGVCIIWFLIPELRMTVLPAFVALTYLALVIAIPAQRVKWLKESLDTNHQL